MPSSRLHLVRPPRLVQVRDVDGVLRPALLVARREDRCYLQVSRSAGDNVLRWLPAVDVGPARAAGPATVLHGGGAQRRPRAWGGPLVRGGNPDDTGQSAP